MSTDSLPIRRKATAAIADGGIAAPPELSQDLIWEYAQLASVQDKKLVPARCRSKYEGKIDGPILLIHENYIFELVDEYDPVTGNAYLAAALDDTWFRIVSSFGAADEGVEFLTWRFEKGSWYLGAMEQYIA